MSPTIVTIPGRDPLSLDHLLIDLNGTLTRAGALLPGVAPRIEALARDLTVEILSSDTFGTAQEIAAELGVGFTRVANGREKLDRIRQVGASGCAAIGNGANDELLLGTAALGICVIGPEGAAPSTLMASDIVCGSIVDALDLLTSPPLIAATLRP